MSEEQIMTEVKNGKLEKAAMLFELYHKPLYHFFFRMSLDSQLSEDLTQNVFVRMIRYRSSYRAEKKFRSWIYQVARNIFYDHIKESKKMPTDDIDNAIMIGVNPDDDDREAVLKKSLLLLDEEDRQILFFSKYQNMKYDQISEILDISVSNVKVKVHRALQKLRKHYFELEQQ